MILQRDYLLRWTVLSGVIRLPEGWEQPRVMPDLLLKRTKKLFSLNYYSLLRRF